MTEKPRYFNTLSPEELRAIASKGGKSTTGMTGFALQTPEGRRAAQLKSVETRKANRLKRERATGL